MPNKYSHSGVLAQYCNAGFISLPDELYSDYIRAAVVGSLTSQSPPSIASQYSSSEDGLDHYLRLTRPRTGSTSSSGDQVHHGGRGRATKAAELPAFPFSHKPNPQDRAVLIDSLVHEIDREIDDELEPTTGQRPPVRDNVEPARRAELPKRQGILIQGSSHIDPSAETNQSYRHDRNAWKSTYPPLFHSGTSSTSLTVSASSGEYTLDIPSDFPVQVDGANIPPQQGQTELDNHKPAHGSIVRQNSAPDGHLLRGRSFDGRQSEQVSKNTTKVPRRSGHFSKLREIDGKPKVSLRTDNSPLRHEGFGDAHANAPKTIERGKIRAAATHASVTTEADFQRSRNSSRSRSRQRSPHKNAEDDRLPSIVNSVALSSDYDSGVRISEPKATAIPRVPSPQPTLPPGSVITGHASNETRKTQPRKGELTRPTSAMSPDTQIYAPLASNLSATLSFTDELTFIPTPNNVRPGFFLESAVELPSETSKVWRRHSQMMTDGQYAVMGSGNESMYNVSTPISTLSSADILSVQSRLPARSQSQNRDSKYAPVYRDRKQEWLGDSTHSVGHYKTYSLKGESAGHRRFALNYSSSRGSAQGSESGSGSVEQRANSLLHTAGEPKLPEVLELSGNDVGPVSVASDTASASTHASEASSGCYPPDIPRYRDETAAAAKELQLKREDNGVALRLTVAVGGIGRRPSSSGQSWRRKKDADKEKAKDKAEHSLFRRLRGVSLNAIR